MIVTLGASDWNNISENLQTLNYLYKIDRDRCSIV